MTLSPKQDLVVKKEALSTVSRHTMPGVGQGTADLRKGSFRGPIQVLLMPGIASNTLSPTWWSQLSRVLAGATAAVSHFDMDEKDASFNFRCTPLPTTPGF